MSWIAVTDSQSSFISYWDVSHAAPGEGDRGVWGFFLNESGGEVVCVPLWRQGLHRKVTYLCDCPDGSALTSLEIYSHHLFLGFWRRTTSLLTFIPEQAGKISQVKLLIDLLHYLCILKGEEIIGFKRLGSEKMFVTYVLLYFCLWYWAWFYNRQKIVSAFFSCIQHLIFIKIVSVSCEGRLISLAPCSRGEKRYELKEVEGEMSST